DLARACRVVIPMKRIEIRKSEILKVGDGEPESIIEEVAVVAPEEASEEVAIEEAAVEEVVEESATEEIASE
ncbi:MAG: 30S ribosomal protein S3ae, partial [Candidatus Methanomethylophilaceae archaeon]|nr:30S ribosomal protein S3ae [Candidatus Methanomethylophilaceae archaeon]